VVAGNGQSEGLHPSRRPASAAGTASAQKRPTSRTSRSRAIRSSACVLRPATAQTSRAAAHAAGLQRPDLAPRPGPAQQGQARCPDRQSSRLTTTETSAPQIAGPALAPAAPTLRAGTDRPQAARPARDRSAGTRRRLASRHRCTRQASSQPGTAAVTASRGQGHPPASLTVPSRAMAAPTASHAPAGPSLAVTSGSSRPGSHHRRAEGRQRPPAPHAITTARTALRASRAIRCWPSATRPPM
jgi:hypothetical protein